jgi:hypothetical protein
MLINPYTPSCTFKNFPTLDDDLIKYYNRIYHTVVDYHITPRYFYETGLKIAFRDIFYYIDSLYDDNPQSVIDVGCGECVWKKYFPNIVGVDPNTNEFSQQDFIDYFDNEFSDGHTKQYDCGMALNSLHYISWNDISKQINLAMNIVNDKFLFTFNFNMMQNVPLVHMIEKIKIFKEILQSTKYNLIMFDSPLHRGITEENINNFAYINGTVRFILQHSTI